MTVKNPRERCLAMLEAQRIARDTWLNAANDAERTLLENVLVVIREYLRQHCKEYKIPYQD